MTELAADLVVTLSPDEKGYMIDEHGPFEVVSRRHLSNGAMLVVLHLKHSGRPPCWIYGQQRRDALRIIDLRLTSGMDGRVIKRELDMRLQNLEGVIYD